MELLDIYNEKGEYIGVESRDVVHRDALWHKTVHCWLYDKAGNVFFQIRKDRGTLYTTASGHLQAGETIADGFHREIKEELGIQIDASDALLVEVVPYQMDREKENGEIFRDRAFANVYIDLYEGNYKDFQMDKEELKGIAIVNAKETLELFRNQRERVLGRIINLDNRMEEKEFSVSDFLVNEHETLLQKYGKILETILTHFGE